MSLTHHLVVHLQQMHATEREYRQYLAEWLPRVQDQQLHSAIQAGMQSIEGEIQRLQHCLHALGQSVAMAKHSPKVRVLRELDEDTAHGTAEATPLDRDVHLAMTDINFGTAEIGVYRDMLTMARTVNHPELIAILNESVQQEEADLQRMQGVLAHLIEEEAGRKAA